ncbi:MAG: ABC transporter ATP-binding protein [Fuerstiella sp.]|nr:ABC transporter ATP-binding protein [Fuerstiella sp.]
MPLIELEKLTKDYGSFRAIDDLSLQIYDGVTGLLGPNGAGKSTLIKVLLGLVRCTSGTGRVLGHDIVKECGAIRTRVGYMPEDDCYMHGLSGVECVQVAAQLSRFPATEALRRGHEILDFCGIGQERYRNVETYSTGMRQKLRFAMAIVHDPELMILDEPTSGLDPEERESMLNRIQILARQMNKAIIICTHILPDVQLVCDRVVILAAGRVTLSEDLEVVRRSPDPSLTVTVHGDIRLFTESLKKRGARIESVSDYSLLVFGSEEIASAAVWQAATETSTAVRSIVPSRTSLEKVFLKTVQEASHANS